MGRPEGNLLKIAGALRSRKPVVIMIVFMLAVTQGLYFPALV